MVKNSKTSKHHDIFPEYFTIPQLCTFAGLGQRYLRDALKDPEHPLPHFRLNSKSIIISRSDFAKWLERFHVDRGDEVDRIVRLVVAGVTR